MRRAELIYVPYDSGHRAARMGRGPLWIRSRGAADRLLAAGIQAEEVVIETVREFSSEVATAFELNRLAADAVTKARAAGRFPWIIAGNCNTGAIGAAVGVGIQDSALMWFDAHDDCETPHTTTSGFFDGMGLAVLTGQCFPQMLRQVTGEAGALPGHLAALVGVRDMSAGAARNLEMAGIDCIAVADIRSDPEMRCVSRVIERMRSAGARRLIAHVDLDVHDPERVGVANGFAVANGLLAQEVQSAILCADAQLPLAGASICSYDPGCDADGRILETALQLIVTITSRAQTDAQ